MREACSKATQLSKPRVAASTGYRAYGVFGLKPHDSNNFALVNRAASFFVLVRKSELGLYQLVGRIASPVSLRRPVWASAFIEQGRVIKGKACRYFSKFSKFLGRKKSSHLWKGSHKTNEKIVNSEAFRRKAAACPLTIRPKDLPFAPTAFRWSSSGSKIPQGIRIRVPSL